MRDGANIVNAIFSDPFKYMQPLGSYHFQIQDEMSYVSGSRGLQYTGLTFGYTCLQCQKFEYRFHSFGL